MPGSNKSLVPQSNVPKQLRIEGTRILYGTVSFDLEILESIMNSDCRMLWAFVRDEYGDVMACPYTEDQVIWLTDKDIERTDEEVP